MNRLEDDRVRHVEDVRDLVQCEVVGVLCCKLVADEDVGVDLVHPALLPVDVGLHLAPHQLVALLGGVGLTIIILKTKFKSDKIKR